ncbi:MAG: hypothetical protein NZM94_15390, partial [Roseiflexus sp.]|nr:hypothetical protein [Roseiflexus sp.]
IACEGRLRSRSPQLLEFGNKIQCRPVQPAPAGFATVARDFRRRAEEQVAMYSETINRRAQRECQIIS